MGAEEWGKKKGREEQKREEGSCLQGRKRRLDFAQAKAELSVGKPPCYLLKSDSH